MPRIRIKICTAAGASFDRANVRPLRDAADRLNIGVYCGKGVFLAAEIVQEKCAIHGGHFRAICYIPDAPLYLITQ